MVDAFRNPVYPGAPYCWPCSAWDNAGCPASTIPVTQGTIEDWGWAVAITPCQYSCYGYAYVEGPAADQLRPYAGTSTTLKLYGDMYCGTVEGCSLQLDRYEVAACNITVPVRPRSWGGLKSHYR